MDYVKPQIETIKSSDVQEVIEVNASDGCGLTSEFCYPSHWFDLCVPSYHDK